ncbi:hypothetical protein HWV62_11435 [Athelia sp. TMB]|nr:hypothetical protein HWV62_11435 [Athelia sp. TMB]
MPGLLQQPLHILELDFGIREQIMIYPNMKNSVFGLAEVEVDGGQLFIHDTGSKLWKGVFVNGIKVDGPALLQTGDILSFDPDNGLATYTVTVTVFRLDDR